jgi:hypothetical protein
MADADAEKGSKKEEENPMTFGESFDSNWGPNAMDRRLGEEEAKKKKKPGTLDPTNNKSGSKS